MRKVIALLLALLMCLSLAACGGDAEEPVNTDSVPVADSSEAQISDEQLAELTAAYNQVAPLYNEAYVTAEANGWLEDETTAAEIQALNSTLGVIGTALTEDLTMLDGVDIDALIGQLLEVEEPINELIERVSVPYEG